MADWRKFPESKPKKRAEYLVWHPERTVDMDGKAVTWVAHAAIIRWNGRSFCTSFEVTHWQPIESPEG